MATKRKRLGPEGMRRRARRRRQMKIGALVGVLMLVAGAALFLSLRGDDYDGDGVAEEVAGGPLALTYADFSEGNKSVRRLLVDEERSEEMIELSRSGAVVAAPGSPLFTVEWWDVEEDMPRLTVVDPVAEEETEIPGPGTDPVWNAKGDRLAYAEPLDLDRCTPEDCEGDVVIHVFDPAAEETEVLEDAGPWAPRFWAGDRLVFGDLDDNLIVHSRGLGTERITFPIRARSAWGASPDGRWLVVSWEEGTSFNRLTPGGELEGEVVDVDLHPNALFSVGAWSHDSSRVAVAITRRASSEFALLGPSDPEPVLIDGMTDQVTRVYWTPRSDGLSITTVTDRFETVYCPVEGLRVGECTPLLDWTSGLSPVRMEGSQS